ncbi:MAG: hypothetical protein V8R40_12675 [Dysosmobacter sp.]|nr:hypothetical protein [uncultured Oscillibacter sp.]
MDYKPLYHKLFNACTDALNDMEKQNFGQARVRLICAQQEAEELYLNQTAAERKAEP